MTGDPKAEPKTEAPQEEPPEPEERPLPPIDEDVTGQVNAAVPPTDDES